MTTVVIPENCPMSEDTLVLDPADRRWRPIGVRLALLLCDLEDMRDCESEATRRFIPKSIIRITSFDGTMSWNFILPAL